MGHHAFGVDPRQALTGSRKSAGQSHLYVTRSKERLPTALAGLFCVLRILRFSTRVRKQRCWKCPTPQANPCAQGIGDAHPRDRLQPF